jgi:hypothetical protein
VCGHALEDEYIGLIKAIFFPHRFAVRGGSGTAQGIARIISVRGCPAQARNAGPSVRYPECRNTDCLECGCRRTFENAVMAKFG